MVAILTQITVCVCVDGLFVVRVCVWLVVFGVCDLCVSCVCRLSERSVAFVGEKLEVLFAS